ncbi:MAG: glycerophosphodiester phosphodiesterase [Sphingomonadales bacterium 12-68-11]|nr:MAG: glycerophosphodiester phosphodiesterase [Sphingomonadales bacterium 12-68-11]OYX16182.1 MAG: glycerophosphodiester phosphodiesterase [Sphingomonadales bacterium 32-67-7]
MSYRCLLPALALACAVLTAGAAAQPLVIAHRGASADRPEHTLAAYELAIEQGADFIEPDVVVTRDGVLVARHENEIGGTTDVAAHQEFAARRTTKTIDGRPVTGWFTEDFTLAELKTLRAAERLAPLRPGSASYNGQFAIPTLQEMIDLARRKEAETGRTIGIIPETKHPTYFASIGLAIEPRLLEVLAANGYADAEDAVIIQSFEVGNLQALAAQTTIRLAQLTATSGQPYDFALAGNPMTYAEMMTPAGLAFVARYAQVLGPDKESVIGRDASGLRAPSTLVADAHAAGLLVVPYTFRPENYFLPGPLRSSADVAARGDQESEVTTYLRAGIDGLFIDAPGLGRGAVDRFAAERSRP